MNRFAPLRPDPQDDESAEYCSVHREHHFGMCPDCFLEGHKREVAQEVADGMADTMKNICVDHARSLVDE